MKSSKKLTKIEPTVKSKRAIQFIDDRVSNYKFKLHLNGSSYALLKLRSANTKLAIQEAKSRLESERIALSTLNGLAVPELLDIDAGEYVEVPRYSTSLAMTWHSWKNVFDRKMTLDEACGLWLFVMEQLAAFRRKQILYTDLKPHHILVRHDFKRGLIVDFDAVTVVDPSGIYYKQHLALTFAYMPPEAVFAKELNETSFVYGTGMLFWSFLFYTFNNNRIGEAKFLKLKKSLVKRGLGELVKLLDQIIHENPRKRPENYEVVFKKASLLIKNPKAIKIWKELRKPYEADLIELGF